MNVYFIHDVEKKGRKIKPSLSSKSNMFENVRVSFMSFTNLFRSFRL